MTLEEQLIKIAGEGKGNSLLDRCWSGIECSQDFSGSFCRKYGCKRAMESVLERELKKK